MLSAGAPSSAAGIVVVAPFPRSGTAHNGWWSRIAAVDRLFQDRRRAYVEVVDDGSLAAPRAERVSERVEVHRLNLALAAHRQRLRSLVLGAEMVYVHTIHLARYLLPFYRTGRVVTDIHGVAPEEERHYGKAESGRFYDDVERVVLAESRYAVAVTLAMVDHLKRKHPQSRTDFVVLPILPTRHPRPTDDLGPRSASGRPAVIYSGGLQLWQNVDLMLDAARQAGERFDFTFLTSETGTLEAAVRQRGLGGAVRVREASPEELPAYYGRADYGLVLRDHHVLNRVSCPTKLTEYLWFGVIPVVKCPELGDFPRWGYRYVSFEDFQAGRLPDAEEQRRMRRLNFEAVARLEAAFEEGARAVRELKDRLPPPPSDALAFLGDLERNVVYPAFSRLEVAPPGGQGEPHRVLSQDFAEPYGSVAFDLGPSPARRLTWTPIDRECRLALESVRITDGSGREIPYRMSGNFLSGASGDLTFRERRPCLHFDLDPGLVPERFVADFEMVLIGQEALAAPLPPPPPPPLAESATPSGGLMARLRSNPLLIRVYRRLLAPLRRRVGRAI